ncbi:glycosyltransferase family 4 protein [Marinivivus vitaminiproducens]|uniref:glycosyltransferase family 4 protein n=1 Tax=Marinivivus vitaminiproducens TaxID=3035935 RepID=UPI00279A96E1|nr:glycosyltransferase family 4 protein [Geminicoccaceae bacterium SCSIO 64248]
MSRRDRPAGCDDDRSACSAQSTAERSRVWIVTVGEPLPIDAGGQRLHRAGILADMLAKRGHEVVWWSSTFEHNGKSLRFDRSTRIVASPNHRIWCLHGRAYRRNVSLARLVNHWQVGRAFDRLIENEPQPDVILAAMPTIELARSAVAYGRRRGVPVAIDIRDLWPDIWVDAMPRPLRGATRAALWPYEQSLRATVRDATAVLGITDGAVDWALAKAARPRTTHDAAFPFGYDPTPPPAEDIEAAERFWDEQGVFANDAFVACFIGSMTHRLQSRLLVEAAALIPAAERSRLRIVLCGNGEARPCLIEKARGLEHVLLPGWINRAQIWTLLRRASIGLLPYPRTLDYVRSIPNKAIEYLSAGVPIVTSMQGDMAVFLTRHACGSVLADEAPEAFAAEILRLSREPMALADLRSHAVATFEDLSAERVYGRMIDHLLRLPRPVQAAFDAPAAPAMVRQ